MKLGYITKHTPLNRKAYSGTHFYMYKALKEQFEEVIPFGPLDSKYKVVPKLKGKILSFISGKTFKYQYDVRLAKRISKKIDRRALVEKPDALLASLMTPEVAYLNTKIPLFITTDATFPQLHDAQNSHSNLHPISIKEAFQLEKKTFKKARKLVLPLKWLADSAMEDYGVSSKKIEVVPYGSNADEPYSKVQFEKALKNRLQSKELKLLFVGKLWEEKGGPFAEEILSKLIKMGIKSKLNILGVSLDKEIPSKSLQSYGFLHKDIDSERLKIEELFNNSSFFILPTLAECVGMSFIESASYGLPAVGTDVGGVPEAILHKETGFIITKVHSAKDVAEWIKSVWEDKTKYEKLSRMAYSHYSKYMNWKNWGKKVKEIISESI